MVGSQEELNIARIMINSPRLMYRTAAEDEFHEIRIYSRVLTRGFVFRSLLTSTIQKFQVRESYVVSVLAPMPW